MKILGTLMHSEVTEVYEEKGEDINVPGCMLCFKCVELCPYEDCMKIKIFDKIVPKSRNWLEPSENE
jgi:formate hydrogenlyase subunit 6/NADH:ubiquinone oxidoreductase subunit I